jgi:hypothetical protein
MTLNYLRHTLNTLALWYTNSYTVKMLLQYHRRANDNCYCFPSLTSQYMLIDGIEVMNTSAFLPSTMGHQHQATLGPQYHPFSPWMHNERLGELLDGYGGRFTFSTMDEK